MTNWVRSVAFAQRGPHPWPTPHCEVERNCDPLQPIGSPVSMLPLKLMNVKSHALLHDGPCVYNDGVGEGQGEAARGKGGENEGSRQ